MSQIETIMLVALGFVGALLIGLLVARGVWAYAVSLGKRRVQRRAPSAIAELQADRDRLKAEYAMQGRRLQLRLDDLKTRMAEQMAEASRNRNRIELLVSEIRNRDEQIAKRDTEIANLKNQSNAMELELADRSELVQQTEDLLLAREKEATELRGRLGVIETRLADQSAFAETARTEPTVAKNAQHMSDISVAEQQFESTHERLRQRIEELNALTRHIDDQQRDLSVQQEELTTLREQIGRSQKSEGKAAAATDDLSGRITADDSAPGEKVAGVLSAVESTSDQLERQIRQAEQETENLTAELSRLDEMWNANIENIDTDDRHGARLSLVPSGPAGTTGKPKTTGKRAASRKARKPKSTAGSKRTAKSRSDTKAAAASGKTGTRAATKKSAAIKPAVKKASAKKAAAKKPAAGKSRKAVSLPEVTMPTLQTSVAAAAGDQAAIASAEKSGALPRQVQQEDDNVISLAQRIRALQTDLSHKP